MCPASSKTACAPFTPDLFAFLRDLARHNDRAWFQANRDRYVEHVRDPMLAFIADFAPRLRTISRRFVADPSPSGGSLFRIHRDVRFAKDRSPYKTMAAAQFRHERGRDVHAPGFYLHLEPDRVFAGAGLWRPDGRTLALVRDAIVEKPAAWRRVAGGAAFAPAGPLRHDGETLKRPPRGYDPTHPLVDDLRRKDFVVVADLDEEAACAPDFADRFADCCRAAAPFVRFLTRAVDLEWSVEPRGKRRSTR